MAPRRKLGTESDDFSSYRGDYSAQASKRLRLCMEEGEEAVGKEEQTEEEDPEEELLEEYEEDPEELPEEVEEEAEKEHPEEEEEDPVIEELLEEYEEDPEELPEAEEEAAERERPEEELLEEHEEDPGELPEEEEAAEKGHPEEDGLEELTEKEEEEEPRHEELIFEEVDEEFAQEEEEKEFEEEESVFKKEDQGNQYELNSAANEIQESCGSVKENAQSRQAGCGRLWNEEDEITTLTGMLEFRYKKGRCACNDLGAFYDFIKDYLQFDASKQQLFGKVKRLKKKYMGNKGDEVNLVFTTLHEERVFRLSNAIWGSEYDDYDDDVDDDDYAIGADGSVETVNKDKVATSHHDGNFEEEEEFWSVFPRLHESLNLEQFSEHTLPGCGARFVKQSLSSIGRSKAVELEDRWRKLHKAEIEVKLMRAQLIQEQTQLILDVM